MKKMYLDMTQYSIVNVLLDGFELIPVGTTIQSMPVTDKNEVYDRLAKEHDVYFIFDDNIPSVDFYTIPYIDIVAVDSCNGYIGTIGEKCDVESNAPICYIDADRNCYLIARNFREFLSNINCWKALIEPFDNVEFFQSRLEVKKYDFLEI